MKIVQGFFHLLNRLRYPASMPEDVGEALGIDLPNTLSFNNFLQKLTSRESQPKSLFKFMTRLEAERAFEKALKKEFFSQSSLFSYHFNEGWMEFELYFDNQNRLRRIWLHHQLIADLEGFEIPLKAVWDEKIPADSDVKDTTSLVSDEEELITALPLDLPAIE